MSGANLAVIGMLLLTHISDHGLGRPPLEVLLLFTAAFMAVGSLQMRLEFSQHRVCFTLTEAVLVIGMLHLPPVWLGIAVGAGEAARSFLNRASAMKCGFNASSHAATGTVAGTAFVACYAGLGGVTGRWLPVLVALTCWGCLNALSISTVIAAAEGRRFNRTLSGALPTALATTVLGTALGLLVQQLWETGPLYPLLVVPLATGVWLNGRHAAAQRDEHLRIERLYEATARTAGLGEDHDVVADIAVEAHHLLTGIAAFCFVRDTTGTWAGQMATAGGVEIAASSGVEELIATAGTLGPSSAIVPVPQCLRSAAPDADMMVIARSPAGSEVDLLVAVLRRASSKKRADTGLGDTLAAYVAHGAVTVANASLVSKLQRSLDAEMQANRRKDEFVATISHELRTPLTVVLGAVQTLIRLHDRVQPEDRNSLLHTAEDQGQRLRLLIEDLLLVAAAEQGKLTCDMAPLVAGKLVEDLRSDLPRNLRYLVQIETSDRDLVANSDRYKVRQVITNLVGNAAKYASGSPIEVAVTGDAGKIRISVVDHGPGIPAADRERVFERFVQLDQTSTRATEGTGLGLFVCKEIADRLQATLKLTETTGGGCTFTLSVPQAEPSTVDGNRAVPERKAQASSGLLRRPDLSVLATTTAA